MSRLGRKLLTLESVLRRPQVSEKASRGSEAAQVYSFWVDRAATKPEIKKAVKKWYQVTPRRVNVMNVPGRKDGRKAIIFLKAGEKINLA